MQRFNNALQTKCQNPFGRPPSNCHFHAAQKESSSLILIDTNIANS